jgi:hypothetical protein
MGRRDPLSALRGAVSAAQDEQLANVDVDRARERLVVSALARRASPSSARRWRVPVAVASLAAAAAALIMFVSRPQPLSFSVDSSPQIAVGDWIGPATSRPTITFSDGTRLDLAPEARARVASVDAHGARIVVETGHVSASVVHTGDSRWSVAAGPFDVRVTGTRFIVSWSPETERFSLQLAEGSVFVTGPLLGEGRTVTTGETLRIAPKEHRLEISGAGDFTSEAPPTPSLTAPAPAVSSAATPIAAPSVITSADAPPALSWQQLEKRGRYKEALAALDAAGFDEVVAKGTVAELLSVADVARFGGSPARAASVLASLRARFPASPESASAAFQLGRAAFDGRANYAEAERWFTLYLSEAPTGAFARDALGRVLECRLRTGDRAGARVIAQRYLTAYPGGPHAEEAKSALSD